MTTDLNEPQLDRSFDEIYRDLRGRIPRYSKEWTNFNDSDPGITLLQLFAWLSEAMYYQMNQVPRKNYLKFLKLLGHQPRAAAPAEVGLTFTTKGTEATQPIPKGSQFGAQVADGQLLVFETMSDLDLIRAPLSVVQVLDGGAFTSVTEANNAEGMSFRPFGWEPAIGNALYLGFDRITGPGRPFPIRMTFRALLPAKATAGKPRKVEAVDRVRVPPVDLVWEYRPNASSPEWEPLNLLKDDSAAFTADGYVEVEGPDKIEAVLDQRLASEPKYWIRVRIDRRNYPKGKTPEVESLRPNAVEAVNLRTEKNRVLGQSNGEARQTLAFPRKPIDKDSLRIRVLPPDATVPVDEDEAGMHELQGEEKEDEKVWMPVDDFYASKPTDRHYRLNSAAGTIEFGDGENGWIPEAGRDIVATVFRYGGGVDGNLAVANTVTLMITQPVGVEKVTNERGAAGGANSESVDDIVLRGPGFLRARGRALTAEDFETLVTEGAQQVKQAKAIAGMHPSHPGVGVPGAVTVLIVPDSEEKPPRASAELIEAVVKLLEPRRLITTEIYVASPTFREVRVEALINMKPTASADRVAAEARQRLEKQLDPRTWKFGRDLAPSEVYRWLLDDKKKDVESVERVNIYVDGRHQDGLSAIALDMDTLFYSGHHMIVVKPSRDL